MTKKIVILFTELSGYILQCFDLAQKHNFQIHVVNYPVNKEAPFQFKKNDNIIFYDRNTFLNKTYILELIFKISPKLILISGWIDKIYLEVIKNTPSKFKKVMMIDTPWTSSMKQKIWVNLFKLKYLNSIDAIWVPGEKQMNYAKKLGFMPNEIYDGLYACDIPFYKEINKKWEAEKKEKFPRKFLYIGRYIHSKGVEELTNTFISIIEKNKLNWELWCVGTGDLWHKRKTHKSIRHFGFVQPEDLDKIIGGSGVFVLPSKYEPWGVVLHEMVTSGMPILISDVVGSKNSFLKNNINGMSFSYKIKGDFESKMTSIMNLSDEELLKMGEESVHLSTRYTPEKWVDTLNKIYG